MQGIQGHLVMERHHSGRAEVLSAPGGVGLDVAACLKADDVDAESRCVGRRKRAAGAGGAAGSALAGAAATELCKVVCGAATQWRRLAAAPRGLIVSSKMLASLLEKPIARGVQRRARGMAMGSRAARLRPVVASMETKFEVPALPFEQHMKTRQALNHLPDLLLDGFAKLLDEKCVSQQSVTRENLSSTIRVLLEEAGLWQAQQRIQQEAAQSSSTSIVYHWQSDGRFHRMPQDFAFPQLDALSVWRIWWLGHPAAGYPPFRALQPSDFTKTNRKMFSEWTVLVRHIVAGVEAIDSKQAVDNLEVAMAVKVGDTVLAYHGVMIYDAKVLKVDNGQGVQQEPGAGGQASASTQYYLHYQGWAKKWDEWVRHDRVLEDTPANRALQQKAKEDMAKAKKEKRLAKKKKISSAGVDAPSARKSPFKRLKRSVENDYEEFPGPGEGGNSDETTSAKQINIQMPFSLKKQLVEDWKNVTQAPHKLVPLPRKPNVSQIIKTYLEFKKSKVHEGEASEEKEYKNIEGIMQGVQSYFDRALSSILLYRMERRQYQELRQNQSEEVPLSQIYGAEHLIRLFVRLPVLLAGSNIAPRELHQIQARLNDFLKFIQKNSAAWFVTEYEAASDKYVEQATAAASSSS
ncbi:hypothetical protein PHYSODRAFT_347945 [Phytophthora sojae]|uniref:Uncharacterized protein n=1 Tax=Phytophthora sojae (strain P6497) TaxID=1094619 RepID=G5A658_PHYSP|nr:hypothetical protein PHYSODRAFT_347945 [Phytophthora sojae]EGZ08813.1 hypothetical protein PHYSODRAFT_347945 [Phytophthora sojae]|eukprot:XP_009535446.1 hypothetical protein PHYSODRAFT_347945 [Phytophthora sojae]